MKIHTIVRGIGDNALEFIEDKILILFLYSVENGIEDYSIRIDLPVIKEDINAGDVFFFNKNKYEIMSIGNKVMETLRSLGHSTLKFDGITVADLPGTIHLEDIDMPEIKTGMSLYVYSKEDIDR